MCVTWASIQLEFILLLLAQHHNSWIYMLSKIHINLSTICIKGRKSKKNRSLLISWRFIWISSRWALVYLRLHVTYVNPYYCTAKQKTFPAHKYMYLYWIYSNTWYMYYILIYSSYRHSDNVHILILEKMEEWNNIFIVLVISIFSDKFQINIRFVIMYNKYFPMIGDFIKWYVNWLNWYLFEIME